MSKFVQEAILNEISRLIEKASRHCGVVYGDYLYGVLLPRHFDSPPIDFNEVTLTFWNHTSCMDDFVIEMGDSLQKLSEEEYLFKIDGEPVARVKIVDSPTSCLDIGDMGFYVEDGEYHFVCSEHVWKCYDDCKLMTAFKMRTATIKDADLLIKLFQNPDQEAERKEVMQEVNMYCSRNWKICRPKCDISCTLSDLKDEESFLQWLQPAPKVELLSPSVMSNIFKIAGKIVGEVKEKNPSPSSMDSFPDLMTDIVKSSGFGEILNIMTKDLKVDVPPPSEIEKHLNEVVPIFTNLGQILKSVPLFPPVPILTSILQAPRPVNAILTETVVDVAPKDDLRKQELMESFEKDLDSLRSKYKDLLS